MKRILIIISTCLVLFSCDKDDYLVDGGISDSNVGTNTFDFLQSHPQLDTLAILIDKAGLKDEVNSETTLFAPNNLSIKRYVNAILTEMRQIDPEAEYTINDIPTDTLTKYMGGYIFHEKITREDMTTEGDFYTAINGEERRISLQPSQDYSGQLSDPVKYVYYTYKGGDTWDDWDKISDDTQIVIRTSNLVSTNGIIHVLQGTHTLFNYKSE